VDGAPVQLANKPLIAYTIEATLKSPMVNRTVVTTDSSSVRELALELGAEAPFIRPEELANSGVTLDRVLQHCMEWLAENEAYRPWAVMSVETSHPIRPPGLLDQVAGLLMEQQLDTVFTVYEERHAFWSVDEYGELSPIGEEETTPRGLRRPLYREIAGLALACRGDLLLNAGRRFGGRVGIVPLREPYALVDTQDPQGLDLAEFFLAHRPAASP
jgi:CMP-N,N'-diacetyllegionaminic acid synthase